MRLLEKLASVQHEIWAHWMTYLFSVCIENSDGSYTIPVEKVQRWKYQIATQFDTLSELEKQSDREQAEKVLTLISEDKDLVREGILKEG